MDSVDQRLNQLRQVAAASVPDAQYELARKLMRPGIFMDEDDNLELRWVFGDIIVNVTLGRINEVYVFNRSTERIVAESQLDISGLQK